MHWVYVVSLHNNGSEGTWNAFLEFQRNVVIPNRGTVRTVRTDGGPEFQKYFEDGLKKMLIHHDQTVAHSSQQNGVSERINLSLIDPQRAMRIATDLPKSTWGYALLHAAFLLNRRPCSAIGGRTPFEMLKGCNPDLSNLRVWGCFAWAVVTHDKRPKLDQRAEECRFLGYAGDGKGCVLWRQCDNKIIYSRDVYFNESRLHTPAPHIVYLANVDDSIDHALCPLTECELYNWRRHVFGQHRRVRTATLRSSSLATRC